MLRIRCIRQALPQLASSAVRNSSTAVIPPPRGPVVDAEVFLTKIGRGMKEAALPKITEWDQLFELSSVELKEAGLSPRQRKYLLLWREKYRQGEALCALPVMKKKHGGERKRKAAGKQ